MATKRTVRQHTVPVMYLKAFASTPDRSGKLVSYSRDTCEARSTSVGQASVKKDAYTIAGDPVLPPMAVEEAFCEIEGAAAGPLQQLRDKGRVGGDDKAKLAFLFGAQLRRTAGTLENRKRATQEMAKPENSIKFIEQRRQELERRYGKEAVDRFIGSIRDGTAQIEFRHRDDILGAIGDLPRYAQDIFKMHWAVLKSPANGFFVTSDSPAYVRRRGHPRDKWTVGIERADLDAEFYFPISPSRFLIASWTPPTRRSKITLARQRELNRLTVLMANRFVFAQVEHPSVEALVRDEQSFRFQYPDLVGDVLGRANRSQ